MFLAVRELLDKLQIRLKPFFPYFGSKWKLALKYNPPIYKYIIEPFAGSASYSLLYPEKNIQLYDLDSAIAELWFYLIHVSESEILSLPTSWFESTNDLHIYQEAKLLISLWNCRGKTTNGYSTVGPKWKDKRYANQFWGDYAKQRVASQLKFIRHWTIEEADYKTIENINATWFIDPPYQKQGRAYKKGSAKLNYTELATWCKSRKGQTIVCESDGAIWLPFKFLGTVAGINRTRRAREAVYIQY